jgi:hypothetical protein
MMVCSNKSREYARGSKGGDCFEEISSIVGA